jgi:DKNYY family protein
VRRFVAVVGAVCAVLAAGCGGDRPPNVLFDAAGYHISGDTVYYLKAFPGKAFKIDGADAATFEAFDSTFARDHTNVYIDGVRLPDADADSFTLLNRPGFARDSTHVFQRDRVFSADPAHFVLMDGELSKDSTSVYWPDGTVLSDDPEHFTIISNTDHYLFAKDRQTVSVNGNAIVGADPVSFVVLHGAYARDGARIFYFTDQMPAADAASFQVVDGPYAGDSARVYWMGKEIAGADPSTFRVLNAAFECSADRSRAYYRDTPIAGADPRTFPPAGAATGCSETTIAFG